MIGLGSDKNMNTESAVFTLSCFPLFFCVCILLDFRTISPHETRLYWPSGWELGIGGKCGVGGVVVEGGEVWWWARWTRHSEIKQPEAEADRCPAERRPMVRTRVIFVISFSGKLVTCLFHRRADNMVVETGSIFSDKTPHYHSFIILMGNLKILTRQI